MDQRTQELVSMLVIGLVAGFLAHLVLGGSGLLTYLLSGVLGAFVGPLVLNAANVNLKLGNALVNKIATATIGAIIVVILARFIR